ncbi:hypothetical protein ACFXNW_18250 [Nocardia sp. NPDC059180]|uniref:hypothetical protein n=1 Tax=Nocardia sp. NPDC059180 TaxID=3346761 RepID=UPI00368670B3
MTNSDTTPTADQTPDSAAHTTGDPVGQLEAACPIRVGDEVTGRVNPTWRARVRSFHFNVGIAECAIETDDGRRGFAPPWALVPADAEPSEEWRDRMQTFKETERSHAMEMLRRKQSEAAEEAEDLAERLKSMAAVVRRGGNPYPGEPVAHLAYDFASALDEVTELVDRVDAAGLSAHRRPEADRDQ